MNFSDAHEAFEDAKRTMMAVDSIAEKIGPMLVGNLRRCGDDTLKKLKNELRDYNIHTGTWRK